MDSVAIFVIASDGSTAFRAVTSSTQSQGRTPGEALDAVRSSASCLDSGTVVVIQPFLPDELFTAKQQHRLSELMDLWRKARDQGTALLADEQRELEQLIESELAAAETRAQRIQETLGG